jgi:predicted nucleic acid-binding protein
LIVLDASAAIELLLNTATGRLIAREIISRETSLHAPHLIDLEIVQAFRRYVLSGEIRESRAITAINHWLGLDVSRYPHEPFVTNIWQYRNNLTAYDAAYVTLAKVLKATLFTCDRALAEITGMDTTIEVISF